MQKNLLSVLAVSVVAGLCAGCFTMATATTESLRNSRDTGMSGRPREHVVVSNYGWYLFNVVPLVCGNAREGASFPWAFFRDEVTADIVHNRLTAYAASKGANLAELNLYVNDSVLFEVPGTSIPIPMPYVLCYKERLVSALLLDPPVALEHGGIEPTASEHGSIGSATPEHGGIEPTAPAPSNDEGRRDMTRLLESIPDGGVK